jgi:arylsulfatase A-like enzyme
MTGRYSNRVGVWHTVQGRSILRPGEICLPEILAAGGYRTGIFGKWHLGDNYPSRPEDKGFQEVVIHRGGGVGQTPDYWGNKYFNDTYFRNGRPEKFEGFCTDIWFNEAMRFIEENRHRPFFCYLATNAPHAPYFAPEEDRARFAHLPSDQAGFLGMITNLDRNVGRLRERLAQWGLEDNTILIFTTDNGTALSVNQAGMKGIKGAEYEGGHRTPFFLRWPNGALLPAGTDVPNLTAHIDVVPTLIELCGLKQPGGVNFDGTSLAPLLKGGKQLRSDRVIVTDSQRVEHPIKWRKSSVMTERWRLVNGRELYDIRLDPGQTDDVSAKYPESVAQLRDHYERWWADVSARFDDYSEIVLGHPRENPSTLTAHDWHEAEQAPFSQRLIEAGTKANGFWAVRFAKPGHYEFRLRRWPRESRLPICAATSAGKALPVAQARLRLNDQEWHCEVQADETAARFSVDLPAESARLRTSFLDKTSEELCGAYYVDVKRL